MSISIVMKKLSIAAAGAVLGIMGAGSSAEAAFLDPVDIVNNWSQLPEPNYSLNRSILSSKQGITWAVDDTLVDVPYTAVTNLPERIGSSSSRDTAGDSEEYGSLVSDFTSSGNFTFSGSLFMPNDNDIAGLLWGYQDADNHYRLSWGSPRVKRGQFPDGSYDTGPYERPDLVVDPNNNNEPGYKGLTIVKEVDGVSNILSSNTSLSWQRSIHYNYSVSRIGNDLSINLIQGEETLFSTIITDTSFMSGRIGFNTAGVEVFYGNTQFSDSSLNTKPVPEPITLLGSGLALGFGVLFKKEYSRKRK